MRKAAMLSPEQLSIELKREFGPLVEDMGKRLLRGHPEKVLLALCEDLVAAFGFPHRDLDRKFVVDHLERRFKFAPSWKPSIQELVDWTAHMLGKRKRYGV